VICIRAACPQINVDLERGALTRARAYWVHVKGAGVEAFLAALFVLHGPVCGGCGDTQQVFVVSNGYVHRGQSFWLRFLFSTGLWGAGEIQQVF